MTLTAVNIADKVFLGDLQDALAWDGPRLCVLESPPYQPVGPDAHIRILYNDKRTGEVYAQRAALDAAAAWIESKRNAQQGNVLVHCAVGIERSPLTVAWWLKKFGGRPDLDAAYSDVIAKRPIVQRRDFWVEKLIEPHPDFDGPRTAQDGASESTV